MEQRVAVDSDVVEGEGEAVVEDARKRRSEEARSVKHEAVLTDA